MSLSAVTVRTVVPFGRHEETSGRTKAVTSSAAVGGCGAPGALAIGNAVAEATVDVSSGCVPAQADDVRASARGNALRRGGRTRTVGSLGRRIRVGLSHLSQLDDALVTSVLRRPHTTA